MATQDFIKKNIIWIITTLFFLGITYATILTQSDKIVDNTKDVRENKISIQNIEKTLVKLDSIEQDISEIKDDCKDIKRIIMKPVFEINKIASNERDIKNNNM